MISIWGEFKISSAYVIIILIYCIWDIICVMHFCNNNISISQVRSTCVEYCIFHIHERLRLHFSKNNQSNNSSNVFLNLKSITTLNTFSYLSWSMCRSNNTTSTKVKLIKCMFDSTCTVFYMHFISTGGLTLLNFLI